MRWLGYLGFGVSIVVPLCLISQSGGEREVPLSIIVPPSEAESQHLLERLKQGEDFAALAKDKSTDPSAHDGGYLGKLDPATLAE